jgi:cytochrome d ubiquinol oxidase subunit II
MVITWYLLLGLLLAGYFALAGFDYGVGMQLGPLGRDEAGRRQALNAIGPLFLGNEVWIVAAIGVLLAAFPTLDGELFIAGYPVVVPLILGLVAVNAGVQLRSRGRRRRGFDLLIAVASVVLAVTWGLLLGNLLAGLPAGRAQPERLFGWFPGLTALALLAIVALHGATYLAWRSGEPVRSRAVRRTRWLVPLALGLSVLAVLGGFLSAQVRHATGQPVAAVLLGLAVLGALAGAGLALRSGRYRAAFLATALACALPVLLVGAARYPEVLPGLPVAGAAAGAPTLNLLGAVALPLFPVLLAVQVLSWWIFRRRPDRPAPTYW